MLKKTFNNNNNQIHIINNHLIMMWQCILETYLDSKNRISFKKYNIVVNYVTLMVEMDVVDVVNFNSISTKF